MTLAPNTGHESPPPNQEVIASRVRELVSGADIEVIPLKDAWDKLSAVPTSTKITVTCSPKFGLERTLALCEKARGAGYQVVPHIAARQIANRRELADITQRLGDLGVTDLYVIGGDAADPVGRYADAGALLEELADIAHPFTEIGIGCYPEGHPKVADYDLLAALHHKQTLATYMVSQLCFDPATVTSWLGETRDAGVTLPLHLGVAGPLNTRKLVELSMKIGVGTSLRYLTKQHGMISNLLLGTSYTPETLLLGLGEALLEPTYGIESVHLFPFNQFDSAVAWQQRR